MKKNADTKAEEPQRKKPGPVANPNLVITSVSLDAELLEWGKNQPGGLAALVRRLLREEKNRIEQGAGQ